MDDNELDKLFGEASAAAEEPSKEGASDSDAAEKDSGAEKMSRMRISPEIPAIQKDLMKK